MPLGASEIYLVLRARNEASLVLRGLGNEITAVGRRAEQASLASSLAARRAAGQTHITQKQQLADARKAQAAALAAQAAFEKRQKQVMAMGSAMTTTGIAVGVVGAIGLASFNKMTNAAIDYNKTVSLTKTQVDKAKVSFEQLDKMGLDLAKHVPVAFEDIQKTLYDIFSSINTNGPGARKILNTIAKAAVGGATDMSTAGRAIIAILNGYKLSADKATHTSDILFQLVRKGVGTYQEFASVIGRVVPSAINAGQSIETMSGMLAFLTRNGLSAAMASSSAARALDAISKPKSIDALHKIGVEVKNASGGFRPMVAIMTDLRHKLEDLKPVAQSTKLSDLFKGSGGTIQAMRFLKMGIHDTKGLFAQMTNNMKHSGGAAKQAYDIMKRTPANKIQLLSDKFTAMRIEIGDFLIPVKMALVKILTKVVDWFEKLSPTAKRWIVTILAVASAVAVVVGIVTLLGGVFVMMSAAAEPLGGVLAVIVGVAVAIAAITAVVIAIKKHWINFNDTIAFFQGLWDDLYPTLKAGAKQIMDSLHGLFHTISGDGGKMKDILKGIGDVVKTAFIDIKTVVKIVWPIIANIISSAIDIAKPLIQGFITVLAGLGKLFDAMPDHAKQAVLALGVIAYFISGTLANAFAALSVKVLLSTRLGLVASGIKNIAVQAGGLKTVLGGFAVGYFIGKFTGLNKQMSTLVGMAAGAAAGFAISGGNPLGAALGGLVGAIGGLIGSWGKEGTAAKSAAEMAKLSFDAQNNAAAILLGTLKEVNGQFNLSVRQAAASALGSTIIPGTGENGNPDLTLLQAGVQQGVDPRLMGEAALGNARALADINTQLVKFGRQHGGSKEGDLGEKISDALLGVMEGLGSARKMWQQYTTATGKAVLPQKEVAKGAKALKGELKGLNREGSAAWTFMGAYTNSVLKAHINYLKQTYKAQILNGSSVKTATKAYKDNVAALKQEMINLGFNIDFVNSLFDLYSKPPKPPTLNARIDALRSTIHDARDQIDALHQSKPPTMDADIGRLRNTIDTAQNKINNLKGKTVPIKLKAQGSMANILIGRRGISQTSGFAAGGKLRGTGGPKSDNMLIAASPGEYVVNAKATKKHGRLIEAINRSGLADGGDVNSVVVKLMSSGFLNRLANGNLKMKMPTPPVPKGGGYAPANLENYAYSLFPGLGWGTNTGYLQSLVALWNGESGWRWNATNASSGAYGIPQALPANKMASAGGDWLTNPETQIRWGLGYIKSVYGNPSNTYSQWLSRDPHWYASGGLVGGGSIPGFADGGGVPSGVRVIRKPSGDRDYVWRGHRYYTLYDVRQAMRDAARAARQQRRILGRTPSGVRAIKKPSGDIDYVWNGHKYSTLFDVRQAMRDASRANAEQRHHEQFVREHTPPGVRAIEKRTGDFNFKWHGNTYSTIPEVKQAIRDAARAKREAFVQDIRSILQDMRSSLHGSVSDIKKVERHLKKATNDLPKELYRRFDRLEALDKRREALQKKIEKWQSKLANLKQARTSLIGSVTSAGRAAFDITGAPPAKDDILGTAGLAKKNIVKFYVGLKKLVKRGFPRSTIIALANAGPNAWPQVQALLSMNAKEILTYTRDINTINREAKKAGEYLGDKFYNSGIKAAEGLIRGLRARRNAIGEAMSRIADILIRRIKRNLGIKSPSSVFHKIGVHTMKGLANGINDGYGHVSDALDYAQSDMSNRISNTNFAQAATGGGGNTYNQEFYITTQEIDPTKHSADLGWQMTRMAR